MSSVLPARARRGADGGKAKKYRLNHSYKEKLTDWSVPAVINGGNIPLYSWLIPFLLKWMGWSFRSESKLLSATCNLVCTMTKQGYSNNYTRCKWCVEYSTAPWGYRKGGQQKSLDEFTKWSNKICVILNIYLHTRSSCKSTSKKWRLESWNSGFFHFQWFRTVLFLTDIPKWSLQKLQQRLPVRFTIFVSRRCLHLMYLTIAIVTYWWNIQRPHRK